MLRRNRLPVLSMIGAAGAMLLLTACTPEPVETPEPTASVEVSPSASPTPEAPVLVPYGSAEDNMPVFVAVTDAVWNSEDRVSGRAYIDALVDAGFDKAAMQVTEDRSTVGNPAESIQFSVRWGDDACLVGQVGPSTGEPETVVMAQLAEGRCLVGETRAIDW